MNKRAFLSKDFSVNKRSPYGDLSLTGQNVKLDTAIGAVEVEKRNGKAVLLKLPKNPPLVKRRYKYKYKDLLKLPPDLSIGTPFQQRIWQYIRKIPFGYTVTYKKIARDLNLGHSYRPIGQACRHNPMPIVIPCHRVVASNGTIGGYSSGLKWKKFLLELEKDRI